ncbi:MAG: hypothetical protein AAFU03_18255 [Bacteroidota bacterium]
MTGLVEFRGDGFRAVLGMVAAYWIFSILAVIGLYGKRRDFAIGGTILTGLLAVLFFWVQVYPYFELERHWPKDLITESGLLSGTTIYVPDSTQLSNALPYFQRVSWNVAETADQSDYLLHSFPNDSTELNTQIFVSGRDLFNKHRFGLIKTKP